MANELMIAPLLPSTGYSDNFRTSMNKKTNKHYFNFNQEWEVFTLRADWPSGCSGEVLAGSTSKKKCQIN